MTARTATTAPTRVLLVDDHDLIRQGLARAFERQDDFEVCGQAASVAEGIRQFTALEPEVVITDVRLPDGLGFELVRSIRETGRDTGVVVLTMYAGDDQLFNALEAGASAFVSKDAPAGEVVAAARHARVSPHSFAAADLPGAMKRKMTPVGPQLTQRETEVLKLLARGMSNRDIGARLYISETTAKFHVGNILRKLGVSRRAEAVYEASKAGLI